MKKRIFETYLIILLLDFAIFMLLRKIGICSDVTVGEIIIATILYSTLYFLCIFIGIRRYKTSTMTIFCIIGNGLVIVLIGLLPKMREEALADIFISGMLTFVIEYIIAMYQIEKYNNEEKKLKMKKHKERVHFEEIDSKGKVTRKGTIKSKTK